MNNDLAPLTPIPDELAPLLPPHLNQAVHEITAKLTAANTPAELAAVISDFSSYLITYGKLSILKDINEKLWKQLIDKTYTVFEAHKDECITKDAFHIQAIASKMINARAGFWKTFRDRYKARQGDSMLKEIEALIRKCKFEFALESDITLIVEKISTQAHVSTNIPLKLTFDGGGTAIFIGTASLKYLDPVKVDSPDCPNSLTDVKDLAGSNFGLWGLVPLFDGDGNLTDFRMYAWEVTGSQDAFKGKCQDVTGRGEMLGNGQRSDVWKGLFTYSHAPGFPNEGWTINDDNSKVSSSGVVGQLVYEWPNRTPLFGGLVNELTGMQIIKLP
jgi:hypothetical protein